MDGTNKNFPSDKENFCPLEFRITNFVSYPPEFSGKNTLFHQNAQFFLLSANNTIITNNKKLRPFKFHSNKSRPNRKYIISNFISGIFKFLNLHRISKNLKDKYFKCIRRHLLITEAAVENRLSSSTNNNNQTRTYFRFSIGRNTYYFGVYVPCLHRHCPVPPTHVTKHGPMCWRHWKDHCKSTTPEPPLHFPKFPKRPKVIRSQRLGISYTKSLAYSSHYQFYVVVSRELTRFSNKPQCLKRFERLTRSPNSNNRAFLLYKENFSLSRRCKHLPGVSQTINLTNIVHTHRRLIDGEFNPYLPITLDLTKIANLPFFD